MSTATTLPVNPSPAAVEFALLQSWLASSSTLRLPLHHIESQQADKGREVQRLLLQNHLQQRGTGDVGPALRVPTAGEERIYTFDTNTLTWTFYDQYPIKPGDEVWIELAATGTGASAPWEAWLWWHGAWHLLTTQSLPISEHATIEEYVEVYVDPARGGTLPVPPVEVDNVQLKPDPGGAFRYWTDAVASSPGADADDYCVDFTQPYDTWHAGSC